MAVIEREKKGRIAFVTVNRPERRNALRFETFGPPAKARLDFRDDPELQVAILTAAPVKVVLEAVDGEVASPEVRPRRVA